MSEVSGIIFLFLFAKFVKKDIIDRNNIKDVALLENIIKYLFNNVGSPISSNKISDYFNSNNVVQKSNHQTIDNYLNMLEKSYIIYRANRTDVKSKSLLKTLGKYVAENPHTIRYYQVAQSISEEY